MQSNVDLSTSQKERLALREHNPSDEDETLADGTERGKASTILSLRADKK